MTTLNKIIAIAFFLFVISARAPISSSDRSAKIKITPGASQCTLTHSIDDFNGTLMIDAQANSSIPGITGNSVFFKNGLLSIDGLESRITGTLNTLASDSIVLDGNAAYVVPEQLQVPAVNVSGQNNILSGFAGFTAPITLANSATQLRLELLSECTQNLVLNGGTIVLDNDLRFGSGSFFVGAGFVDCNGKIIHLSHQNTSWTSTLNLGNVRNLELNGRLDLSGAWMLAPVGAVTVVQGNGNVLDLSSGGTIIIPANHTLVLRDLELQGLAIGKGWLNFYDQTSTVSFVGCSIGLHSSITYTQGNWYFSDVPSTIITSSNTLNFIGNSTLTIDGISLTSDDLITGVNRNIMPQFANANLIYKNNGRIIVPGSDASRRPDDPATRLTIDNASTVLTQNDAVSSAYKLYFRGNSAASMTLDGQGYTLRLSKSDVPVLSVAAGKTVTLKNLVLDGLRSNHITYGDIASNLVIGDNCKIIFNDNLSFSRTITFTGSVILDGGDHTLSLTVQRGIYVDYNSTLSIINARLTGAVPRLSYLYFPDGYAPFSSSQLGSKYQFTSSPNAGFIGEIACDWHPGGNYLVTNKQLGSSNGYNLFRYDGSNDSLTLLPSAFPANTGGTLSHGQPLEWRADGNYLLVSSNLGSQVLSFNSSTEQFTSVVTLNHTRQPDTSVIGKKSAWSPSGQYIAQSYYSTTPTAAPGFDIYKVSNESPLTFDFVLRTTLGFTFSPVSFTQLGAKYTIVSPGGGIGEVSAYWNPQGTTLVTGRLQDSDPGFEVFAYNSSDDSLTKIRDFPSSELGNNHGQRAVWRSTGGYLALPGSTGTRIYSYNDATRAFTLSTVLMMGNPQFSSAEVSDLDWVGNTLIHSYYYHGPNPAGFDVYKITSESPLTFSLTYRTTLSGNNSGWPGGQPYLSLGLHPNEQYFLARDFNNGLALTNVYKIVGNSIVQGALIPAPSGSFIAGVRFSPDGTMIAVEGYSPGSITVHSFDATTGAIGSASNTVSVGGSFGYDFGLRWSDNGKYIFYTMSSGGGTTAFGVIQVNSATSITALTQYNYSEAGDSNTGRASGLSFNGNNQRIAFCVNNRSNSPESVKIRLIATSGLGLVPPPVSIISWHPNDQHIALSNGATLNGIYRLSGNLLSSVLTFTPQATNSITGLRFSPDGTKIAITQTSPASVQILGFNPTTQTLTGSGNVLNLGASLSSAIPYEFGLRWAPSGQYLFVTASEDKAFNILNVDSNLTLSIANQYSAGTSVNVSRGSGLSYNSINKRAVFALNNRVGGTETTDIRLVSMGGLQVLDPIPVFPVGSFFANNGAHVHFHDSSWILGDNYTFSTGELSFGGDCIITGSGKFLSYQPTTTLQSLIKSDSRLTIDRNVTFSLNTSTTTQKIFQDKSSILALDQSTLFMTGSGCNLSGGSLLVTHSGTLHGFVRSTVNASCDLSILPGAQLEIKGLVNL